MTAPRTPDRAKECGLPALCGLSAVADLPPLPPKAPLDEKLARSRQILDALLNTPGLVPARAAVAYTGGKDSTIALHLWRVALNTAGRGPLRAISVDTGLKFPEMVAHRDRVAEKWGVELTLAKPRLKVPANPPVGSQLACCRALKIEPLGTAIRHTDTWALITGIRRDENPSRALRPYVEDRPATELVPAHWQVNPLLDWTELDVWACITAQGLPYSELYHQGYRSLSCVPCTLRSEGEIGDGDERAGRAQDKERQMETLKSLGYF